MLLPSRRTTLRLGAAAIGAGALPRFAIAQSDNRPTITIAVQKVSNSNTLDVLREQSNVGERVFFTSLWEALIGRDWLGKLEPQPGLATEWKRVDDQTVELKLRQGVKFHNGEEMTAEDVVFSFSRERMFGNTEAKNRTTIKAFERIPSPRPGKELPPEVIAVSRRAWPDLVRVEAVDKLYGALLQRDAGRDARRPARPVRLEHREPKGLGRGRQLPRLGAQADHHRPLQGRRVQAGQHAGARSP